MPPHPFIPPEAGEPIDLLRLPDSKHDGCIFLRYAFNKFDFPIGKFRDKLVEMGR
jgi:hypothetical protein